MKNDLTRKPAANLLAPIKNEQELQRIVRSILRDPQTECYSTDGVRLSILSVGEWNHQDGPDFLNMALQAEGKSIIGHGEVHWRSSDWERHKHDEHSMYHQLLLHIVLHDNRADKSFARYTLIISDEMLNRYRADAPDLTKPQPTSDAEGVVRDFALQRFTRKAEYAKALLERQIPEEVFMRLLSDFCQRRLQTKHLPKGIVSLLGILDQPEHPDIAAFLRVFTAPLSKKSDETKAAISQILTSSVFGKGTTCEIVVNILLPMLYALNELAKNKSTSSALLHWFWSLRAANQYAHLQRKFPHLPQRYVWQQQGLLEYETEIGCQERNAVSRDRQGIQAFAAHSNGEMVMTFFVE